jgi:hypothetical protein
MYFFEDGVQCFYIGIILYSFVRYSRCNAMKTCGEEVEVKPKQFVTSILNECKWPASRSDPRYEVGRRKHFGSSWTYLLMFSGDSEVSNDGILMQLLICWTLSTVTFFIKTMFRKLDSTSILGQKAYLISPKR